MILLLRVVYFASVCPLIALTTFSIEGNPSEEKPYFNQTSQVPKFTFKSKGNNRSTNRIQFLKDDSSVIFEVKGGLGIGSGKIKLETGNWPTKVLVRLYLKGLEGFYISNGNKKVEGFFPPFPATHLNRNKYVKIQMFNRHGKTLEGKYLSNSGQSKDSKSLQGDAVQGYFEIMIPSTLLTPEITELEINWVDFYRR